MKYFIGAVAALTILGLGLYGFAQVMAQGEQERAIEATATAVAVPAYKEPVRMTDYKGIGTCVLNAAAMTTGSEYGRVTQNGWSFVWGLHPRPAGQEAGEGKVERLGDRPAVLFEGNVPAAGISSSLQLPVGERAIFRITAPEDAGFGFGVYPAPGTPLQQFTSSEMLTDSAIGNAVRRKVCQAQAS